jgi:hypothetical protein
MTPLVEAASWSVANELVRAFPDWRIFHTHPGGGQYDCLLLVDHADPPSVRININRHGSIHAQAVASDGEQIGSSDSDWLQSLVRGMRPRDLACNVAQSVGLKWPGSTPATTRRSLTYRVLGQVVVNASLARHPLSATTWWFDSSSDDDGYLLATTPHRELESVDPSEVWVLMDGEEPKGWLWNGWAWAATYERIDLYERYRRGGSVGSLSALIVDLSRRSGDTESAPHWVER